MPIGAIFRGLKNLVSAPIKAVSTVASVIPGLQGFTAKGNLVLNLLGAGDRLFNGGNHKMQGSDEFARLLAVSQQIRAAFSERR